MKGESSFIQLLFFPKQSSHRVHRALHRALVLFQRHGGVKGSTAELQVIRLAAHRLAEALMRAVILVQIHQNLALQAVPLRILAIGASQLTQGVLIAALLHQLARQRFCILTGYGVKANLPLGGDAQRFLVGQVQADQLLLRLVGLRLILKLIGMAALDAAAVRGMHLRLISVPAQPISIRGISIAVLAYTDTLSADSKKAVPDATARERMVTVFDADQARQDIRAARERGADIVLVAMHWGGANDTAPTAAQRTAAQALCEAGADIIIGAHSNAVQPVEYLSSAQDTAHSTLVAWSMGTLLSASRANREVVSGMLLHLTLSYDMQRRALSIASVQYTPTYCWGQKTDALYKYRVLCSAEEAPNDMIQKQREIMGRALKLIQDTMAKGVAVQR